MTKKSKSIFDAFAGATQRLLTAKQFHSGELEELRKQRLAAGDLPWRILRYQRVIDPEKLSFPLSNFVFVHEKTFEKHLRYLTRECRVVPLPQLVEAVLQKHSIPDKTVALTFDGGWVDTFIYAFPLLHQYQLPFTVFLPTAFVGTDDFFWQDKVLFALLWIKKLGGKVAPFPFFPEEIQQAIANALEADGSLTLPAISMFVSALEISPPEDRAVGIQALAGVMQQQHLGLPSDPTFMSWDEARNMERVGVQFASLGHTHALYTELSEEQIQNDLNATKEAMRDVLQQPLNYFAFPAGRISQAGLAELEKRGYRAAFGNDDVPSPAGLFRNMPVFRRISMFEASCDSTEMFVARLWDIDIATTPKNKK